ncbi:MAG: transposase family protein, partial [Cenarchaeum sp. SB0661_bin_35]|nr:transposase family protein [Cenarchaeum sp. SB0661_bin_35]
MSVMLKICVVGRPLHYHGLQALLSEWGESSCIFCGRRLSKWRQAALMGDCSHLGHCGGQYISGGEKILQGKENATIFIDGTHIRTQRSSDYTTQKENYSGKKKFHSKNVLMITTNNGMIIG